MSTVVAHDTTNRIHMLFHVMNTPEQVAAALLADLAAIKAAAKAELVFCCFDSPGPTHRKQICPTYKANRPPAAEGLRETLQCSLNAVDQAGYPTVSVKGWEADDLLATIAKRARDEGRRCIIATPDKDARQCLRPGEVSILRQYRRERDRLANPIWLTADKLREQFGFGPERWIDYQCLVGDATDDIVGWQGVGEKTAAKWLQVAPLDEIIATPGLVTMNATQEANAADFVARLPIVRQLVTLREDVSI